jgi:hypothetical protein
MGWRARSPLSRLGVRPRLFTSYILRRVYRQTFRMGQKGEAQSDLCVETIAAVRLIPPASAGTSVPRFGSSPRYLAATAPSGLNFCAFAHRFLFQT